MDNNYLRILYRINIRDEIVFVNDEWTQFAIANDGSELLPDKVLNQSLWNFITHSTTEFLYREILKKVRAGKIMKFNIRCDSPTMRRIAAVTISSPDNDGEVQFATRTLWAERRKSEIRFTNETTLAECMLIICSWCKKVNVGKEVWAEVEDAITILGLFELEHLPPQSHGICNACYREMSERLEKLQTA